ncbi:uncharacterized protein LOC125673128 [Ostrea edulis]|uniref:uncharacterized protein LOC125673128 n=1 Tax=Ostrea edulis TaxID=37623 RepID=UPI0020964ABF|nr:uncharacterized protein LOC125673128 [Ostrea edulis]
MAQVALPCCQIHTNDELTIYCKDCKKNVCEECVKDEHSSHSWESVGKFSKKLSSSLRSTSTRIRTTNVAELRRQLVKVTETCHSAKTRFQKAENEISRQEEEVIKSVSLWAESLRDQHSRQTSAYLSGLEEKKNDLEQRIVHFEKLATDLEEMGPSLSQLELIERVQEIEEKMEEETSISFDDLSYRNFCKGQIDMEKLKAMVGNLENKKEPEMADKEKHTTATPVGDGVHLGNENLLSMTAISSEAAWVHRSKSSKIELVNKKGETLEEVDLKTLFATFTLMDNRDHIFASRGERCIKKFSALDGDISTLFHTKPLYPIGISRAGQQSLLLSFEDEKNFNPKQKSRRIVQKVSVKGKVEATYEFEKGSTRRLFTRPIRVLAQNDRIYVIDQTSESSGKLVVLRENGQPHSVYNGQNLKSPFCPQGVCASRSGNIFVSDTNNAAIHLLNMDAVFVKILIQGKLISLPTSLTLKNDQLWVGTATGHIKVFQITNE